MSPRKYDNSRRRAAAEETRARIIQAAFDVHAEQGIAGARLDEIARRAEVSVGTVYRHFPQYEELVAACGRHTFERIPPPSPEEVRDRRVSIEEMVDRIVGFYERSGPLLELMRRDRGRLRSVDDALTRIDDGTAAWIDAAVPGAPPAVRALLDHRTWSAMGDAGVADARALLRSLVDKVTRHG